MSEEELHREIRSGAFSMQVADCERNIRIQFEKLQDENKQLKDNWNKLKKYLINDINDRNGTKIVEFEDGNRVSETISPIYTLMEDKSRTMKEVLDKMQELEGSDSNEFENIY